MLSAQILIVRQESPAINQFIRFLQDQQQQVQIAENDRQALQILYTQKPDAVLLDSRAINFCGFELSRCIKDEPEFSTLPLIFMGAPQGNDDAKKNAFKVGAVDYFSHPLVCDEVLARLHTHIANARLHDQYLHRNTLLRQQNIALLREARKLRQQNVELDAFAHTVAHELKNTLNSLHDHAWMLEQNYAEQISSEGQADFKRLDRQILKMSDIIDSLLLLAGTSSRHEGGVYCDVVYMEMILAKVWERLDDSVKFYRPEIIVPQKWPTAVGYPAWIEEIWVNYISNALKYGGIPPRIELGAQMRRKMVRFWVTDNGPGLSAEEQACLFKPFTRLHRDRAEGHGLGLSIVKNMVHKLGGKVGVKSKLGHGSSFYFSLPAQLAANHQLHIDESDFIFERIIASLPQA
jgi:two-component system, sensor histidine kinase and response regulator